MTKKLQLQIPVPCHENWENMTPTDKGRFCSSCQKKVIDFSDMSDREVALFFKKPSTGSVCGRFSEDQLNRDIAIPKKRIPCFKYFLQISLPVFLISMKVSGQKQNPKATIVKEKCTATMGKTEWILKPNTNINAIPHLTKFQRATEAKVRHSFIVTMRGTVVDEEGKVIPFASVVIKGTTIGVMADSIGRFSMSANRLSDVTLVASCVGFAPSEISLSQIDFRAEMKIGLKHNNDLGLVIVSSWVACRRTCLVGSVAAIRTSGETPNKSSSSTFKAYPNPMPRNSTLHIEWNQKEFGDHVLELFNQSGELVFSKEIYIDQEAKLLEVTPPPLSAGDYFLRVTDKSAGTSHSQKLVIN